VELTDSQPQRKTHPHARTEAPAPAVTHAHAPAVTPAHAPAAAQTHAPAARQTHAPAAAQTHATAVAQRRLHVPARPQKIAQWTGLSRPIERFCPHVILPSRVVCLAGPPERVALPAGPGRSVVVQRQLARAAAPHA